MAYFIRPCTLEMDYETYMRFVIRHHRELRLPYAFAVRLSFMASPLALGQALLVVDEESWELVGAAGFVYGTGAGEYEDRHICQVEVAFLLEPQRRTLLFARVMQAVVELAERNNPDVRFLQFWAPADWTRSEGIVRKLLSLPGSNVREDNGMALCRIPFDELARYCRRLNDRRTA